MAMAFGLTSGALWMIAYALLLYRSFKDRSYAMPMAALALNITWEFVFSFVYPPEGLGPIFVARNAIWFLLDIALLVTLLRNGPKYFKEEYGMGRPAFYGATAIALVISALVMLMGGPFFAPFDYFQGDIFEAAKFIAMLQNAVMSILFVQMFYTRKRMGRPIEGQSFYAGIARLFGTSLTVGILHIIVHPGNWYFITVISATCLIFDLWYTTLIYRELKANGINPFVRA